MNLPDKKQEEYLKRLKGANEVTFSDLIIPMPKMCNEVSYDEEKKNYRSKGMRRSREAVK